MADADDRVIVTPDEAKRAELVEKIAKARMPPGYDFALLGELVQRLEVLESRVADSERRLQNWDERVGVLESEEHAGCDRETVGISLTYAMGMTLAIILSWSRNASILWCILHGLLSWVYVLYVSIMRAA
jgi:hypothetical protein